MIIKIDATPVVTKLTEAQDRFHLILQEVAKGDKADLGKIKKWATEGHKRGQQAGLALEKLRVISAK